MKIRKQMERKLSRKAALPAVILLTVLLAACGPKTSEGDAAADTKTQGDAAADTKAQDSPQEAAETASQAGAETESVSAGEGEATSDSSCDSFQSGRSRYGWWRSTNKYTKEDYEQILSWQAAGYENSSVAKFNRMVMDWEDEETFHKAEEVLRRVYSSLADTDPVADFVYGTLSNTWDECERKHYGVCQRQKNPWHSGEAFLETYGDVFGDKEFLSGGYADYSYDYRIPDEQNVTVAQRDSILKGVDEKMQAFLQKQTTEDLQKEEAMEKAADGELERILKALDGQLVWEGGKELSYYWDDVYDKGKAEDWNEDTEEAKSVDPAKQYEIVMNELKFPGYEEMSIAEFNRKINAVFNGYEEGKEDFYDAYDYVMEHLEDTDGNAEFLRTTVRASQDEYYARQRELYSQKQVDPSYDVQFSSSREEDVFGDKMVVQMAEGYYSFTYHILDADKLTVSARDAFLKAVTQAVKEEIDRVFGKGGMEEAQLKKVIDNAGKTAGNSYIEYTGCEVDYLYMEDYGE